MTARPQDERGSAPVELALGMVVLVLPVAMLVAVLPRWVEHEVAARLAAGEAARAAARTGGAGGLVEGERLARDILANHGIADAGVEEVSVVAGHDPRAARSGDVVATVRVVVPVVAMPLGGRVGGFTLTAREHAPLDPYRSLPP